MRPRRFREVWTMNSASFDGFTKALSATKTRRGMLRAFVASVVGVAAGIPARTSAQTLQPCTTTPDCPEGRLCTSGGVCIKRSVRRGDPDWPETCRVFCDDEEKMCLSLCSGTDDLCHYNCAARKDSCTSRCRN